MTLSDKYRTKKNNKIKDISYAATLLVCQTL